MAWTKKQTAFVVGAVMLLLAGTTTVTVKTMKSHGIPKEAGQYQANRDAASLFAILHKYVRNGDSMEDDEKLLGAGKPPERLNQFLVSEHELAQQHALDFPDGVHDTDTFLGYEFPGHHGPNKATLTLHLQFRDGKLINFDPANYQNPPP